MLKRPLALVILLLVLASCAPAAPNPTPTPVPLRGVGSYIPVWESLTSVFTPPSALEPAPNDWALGAIATGRADFAISDDPAARDRYPNLDFTPIAVDQLAVIAHTDVELDTLTLAQLRDLFGGYGAEGSLQLVAREPGSGVRSAFERTVMAGRPLALTALLKPSDAALIDYITDHPGSLGFASASALGDADVNIIAIEGVHPFEPGYALTLPIDFVLPPSPRPEAITLRDWLLGDEAQRILSDHFAAP